MNIETLSWFPQLVGGDEARFFREHWRKRTLFTPGAVPELRGWYDVARFIEDYGRVGYHDATLLIGLDEQHRRVMLRPNQNVVGEALGQGMSVVLQALQLPEQAIDATPQWRFFLNLYDALCAYLLPGFPSRAPAGGPVAALDIFCTTAETSIGGHYDTGDVFYFVLDGEKEWTVELVPDPAEGHRLTATGTNYTLDRSALKEHINITVTPGDCLYVPPYTYHRVQSHGRSLAVSCGLPTYTEVTLLRTALSRIQQERMIFEPLPSYPRTEGDLFERAEREVKQRAGAVLDLLATR